MVLSHTEGFTILNHITYVAICLSASLLPLYHDELFRLRSLQPLQYLLTEVIVIDMRKMGHLCPQRPLKSVSDNGSFLEQAQN